MDLRSDMDLEGLGLNGEGASVPSCIVYDHLPSLLEIIRPYRPEDR